MLAEAFGVEGGGARDEAGRGQGLDDVVGRHVAVSYTHLRAHETVLDLVCRLLLEKKKTASKTPTH